MENKIQLDKLKFVISELIEAYARDSGQNEIVIPEDKKFYWNVAPDEMAVSETQSPKLNVGNLADDWEFLERMLSSGYKPMSIMLLHVYPIISYMVKEVIQKTIVPKE